MIGILLAAGRGTRMKSDKPKVLFDVNDDVLCFAGLKALMEISDQVVVVVGYRGEEVKKALRDRAIQEWGESKVQSLLSFQTQDPPNGTGDAVKVALQGISHHIKKDDEIIVLNGDLPLVRTSTLKTLIKAAKAEKAQSACLTQRVRKPLGLGRILRDPMGIFIGIREEKDATPDEKKITEINGGIYYFQAAYLTEHVQKLKSSNSQNEFYLTDLLGNSQRSRNSLAVGLRNPFDLMGVNNTLELSAVRRISQYRLQRKLCEDFGVDFVDPSTVYISSRAIFGNACRIGPSVVIKGNCQIGKDVVIDGNSLIENSEIGEGCHILWGSVIQASRLGNRCSVGPMAHLRPQTELGDEVKIGNFVELKKTQMGKGAKASHLSYLGDAVVGENSNIGCGTITCNYDGFAKHMTIIGARSFIGSDTQLVAPVKIGEGAYVASGTTVTQDVPAGALALSRPEMVIKENYAQVLEARLAKQKKKKES